MAGSDGGSNPQTAVDIAWVGRSESDPYWNRCHGEFVVRDFPTVYEATAHLLTGLECRCMVLNGGSLWRDLKTVVTSLLSRELVRQIFVYSPVKQLLTANTFSFNGDARVHLAEDDSELLELLRNNFATIPTEEETPEPEAETKTEEIIDEAPSPAAVWPEEPPRREPPSPEPAPQKLDILIQDPPDEVIESSPMEVPAEAEPEKGPTTPNDQPAENGNLAQLTSEELNALLDEDFETDEKE